MVALLVLNAFSTQVFVAFPKRWWYRARSAVLSMKHPVEAEAGRPRKHVSAPVQSIKDQVDSCLGLSSPAVFLSLTCVT